MTYRTEMTRWTDRQTDRRANTNQTNTVIESVSKIALLGFTIHDIVPLSGSSPLIIR